MSQERSRHFLALWRGPHIFVQHGALLRVPLSLGAAPQHQALAQVFVRASLTPDL